MESTKRVKVSAKILDQISQSTIFKQLPFGLLSNDTFSSAKEFWDKGVKTMYAISFDLDTATLQNSYHNASWNNAYYDIRTQLANHGFDHQQGSVYFGNKEVNAVTCVLAVIDLTHTYDWFAASVRDIRMLRIEEQNDLLPAIQQAASTQEKS